MFRIPWSSEWRSDVCFECRFSPFVSAGAAAVVPSRRIVAPFVPLSSFALPPFFPLYLIALSRRSRNLRRRNRQPRTLNTPGDFYLIRKREASLPVARHRARTRYGRRRPRSVFRIFVLPSSTGFNARSTNLILAVTPDAHCSPFAERGFQETDRRTITFTDLFSGQPPSTSQLSRQV